MVTDWSRSLLGGDPVRLLLVRILPRFADRIAESRVHLPGCLGLHPRQYVTVYVQGGGSACVTQTLGDHLQRDGFSQHPNRVRCRRSWKRTSGQPVLAARCSKALEITFVFHGVPSS
jgi:hypothetical protein